jgi:hypothetical protein
VKIQPFPGKLSARISPPFAATALRLIENEKGRSCERP